MNRPCFETTSNNSNVLIRWALVLDGLLKPTFQLKHKSPTANQSFHTGKAKLDFAPIFRNSLWNPFEGRRTSKSVVPSSPSLHRVGPLHKQRGLPTPCNFLPSMTMLASSTLDSQQDDLNLWPVHMESYRERLWKKLHGRRCVGKSSLKQVRSFCDCCEGMLSLLILYARRH